MKNYLIRFLLLFKPYTCAYIYHINDSKNCIMAKRVKFKSFGGHIFRLKTQDCKNPDQDMDYDFTLTNLTNLTKKNK